jgi:hypothetical protein
MNLVVKETKQEETKQEEPILREVKRPRELKDQVIKNKNITN